MPRVGQDVTEKNGDGFGCCDYVLIIISYALFILTLPLAVFFSIKIVKEYERAVIMRLGRILPGGAKGPGLFFILPCIDEIANVDLRTVTFDVPPQEILTKDSVTVTIDAVCYYRIFSPIMSVINVQNAKYSTQLLTATTLRNVTGTRSLQEILREKDHLSEEMQELLDTASSNWGIKIERIEIKDVRLPHNMQRAMATEAEATRDAKAKVIGAEGEEKASWALKGAADIISGNPVALQLRYLQTLTNMCAEKPSTILFPVPMNMMPGK